MKRYGAEFFGTFWLVLGGCGSAVLAAAFPNVGIGLLGVALAFGLTVVTMAYAIGHISGGHLNPAVSIGLWAGGRFPAAQLLPYVVSQVLGGIAAGGVLYLIASGKPGFELAAGFASNGYAEHSPGGYSLFAALVCEVVMTAMFLLVIMGTFATRSGLVSSVHSFAQSQIGVPMLIFVATMMTGCLGLWAWRWQRGDLASDNQLDSLISRESMFVLNNWIFIAIALLVLWGSYAPVVTDALGLQKITLGSEYYTATVIPLFGIMYVLMGVGPLVAWKKSSIAALGKAVRIPIILTAVTIVVMIVLGTQEPGAWFSYGLIAFAAFATLTEFYRGVRARMAKGENPLTANWLGVIAGVMAAISSIWAW